MVEPRAGKWVGHLVDRSVAVKADNLVVMSAENSVVLKAGM